MIFRQFLGLGIPPPPTAVMKIPNSPCVHGGDSGCSGEDREKNRGRLIEIERTYAFLVRAHLKQMGSRQILKMILPASQWSK